MSETSTVPTIAEITGQTDLNRIYEERFGFRVGLMAVSQLKGCLSKTNPRKHDERNLGAIERSIKNFGFKGFVCLDRELEVIYGHGRIEGADRRGLEELPVMIALDLDKLEAEGLRLADNQTTDLSTWDPALASAALDRLSAGGQDPIQVGFDKDALAALGEALARHGATNEGGQSSLPPEATAGPPRQEPALKSEVLIEIRCAKADLEDFLDVLNEWGERDGVSVDIS